jgi:hypothetical protein
MAIYLRASLALIRRFFKRIYRQLIDALIIFIGFMIGLPFWENFKFKMPDYYPNEFLNYVVPGYILIWILFAYYSGGYDKPLKIWKYFRGILVGTFAILVIYALLPESLRYSRALILLGSIWTFISTGLWRWLMHVIGLNDYKIDLNKKKRIVIVGELKEAERVSKVLSKTQIKPDIIGYVSTETDFLKPFIGSVDQIEDIARIYKLDEILFCAANISSQRIINIMTQLNKLNVNYKIAPPESLSIIGSNSINTSGDLYTIHFNSIGKESNLRSKRLFDVISSLSLIVTFPFWFLLIKKPVRALTNLFRVLFGWKTIVGYCAREGTDISSLPKLRTGILNPAISIEENQNETDTCNKLNMIYAKDYKISSDLQVLWKGFNRIGLL